MRRIVLVIAHVLTGGDGGQAAGSRPSTMVKCVCVPAPSYLGDVGFDALGQFDAGFPEELGQLVRDVLVLIQRVQ